jgi:hypothetical protein
MKFLQSCQRAHNTSSRVLRTIPRHPRTMDPTFRDQVPSQPRGQAQGYDSYRAAMNRPPPPQRHPFPSRPADTHIIQRGPVPVIETRIPEGSRKSPRNMNTKATRTLEHRDRKVMPSRASGGIPDPTPPYLATSSAVPHYLAEPQHLLVVIDLNGTLLYRPSKRQPTHFTIRPNALPFLNYCINTFTVVIWSSAKGENVRNMCDAILTPTLKAKVAAIWGRDKFGLSKEDYLLRVQCYKRLTKLWSDPDISRSHPLYDQNCRWDQTNTVLVDDSLEKARSEPYNILEIPEFFGDVREPGNILPQIHDCVNRLSMHDNVSAYLRTYPFRPQLPTAPKGAPTPQGAPTVRAVEAVQAAPAIDVGSIGMCES